MGRPNALIYLTADFSILRERMITDGRPKWLVDSLELQLGLYKTFMKKLDSPKVVIDTNNLSLFDLESIAEWVSKTMYKASTGLFTRFEKYNVTWS